MNITLFFFIIVFVKTNSSYVNTRQDIKEQSVLLRKLQSLEDYNSRNASQMQTWSEILADVFVNRIFTFNTLSNEEEKKNNSNITSNTNVWVRRISVVIEWYKVNIYDRIRNNLSIKNATNDNTIFKSSYNISEWNIDPKGDVEVIEQKYHGKLCDNCKDSVTDEIVVKKEKVCENGLQKNSDGNCVDVKVSKFILAIPYQCPIGYRRDWLGYCRVTMQ